ncbi:MAG: ATP-binding protein [Lachnospiraceae bacterium]|nr:ATP-binding protein [Lachnospiraceae bacterium]
MVYLYGAIASVLTSFFLQIYIGSLLFTTGYRRKRSVRQILPVVLVFLGLAILLMWFFFYTDVIWYSQLIYYILCVAFLYLTLMYSYEESKEELLLCTVSGYLSQHIASQVNQSFFVYQVDASIVSRMEPDGYIMLYSIIHGCMTAVIYFGIYHLFAKRTKRLPETPIVKKSMMILSGVTFLLVIFFSGVRDHYASQSYTLTVVSRVFSVFCCIFIFVLRYNIIQMQEQEMENRLLAQMNQMQLHQFKLSQETIELINLKCHDMRHEIRVWEKRGFSDKKELEELQNLISIYDTSVKTGNDVLDTILTEKSIFCEYNEIHLSCIMDGQWLSFMKESDICTLFGNALENAIEAVLKIENPENRMISMRLVKRQNMLVFTCENYYNGEIGMSNGLPKTTKEDESFHGFGIRSIRRVATSYGGEATIELDELFHLSVIIPIKTI